MEASECAACGGNRPGRTGRWSILPESWKWFAEEAGFVSMEGLRVCSDCMCKQETRATRADIEARRRSAPQPPKSAEPLCLAADGRAIHVGDRLRHESESQKHRVVTVTQVIDERRFLASGDPDEAFPETHRRTGLNWRHLHPEAATDGAEKPKPHYREGSDMARLEKKIRGDRWTQPEQVGWHGALNAVLVQTAMVKRLDFDLRMLKLLGQGWSRGDLSAHLSRLARPASERSGR